MTNSADSSHRSSLSEEFHFLCMLHNIGATTPDKSLSLNDISEWTEMDAPVVRVHLQRLTDLGYIQLIKVEETEKYHLTQSGIRKVLTLYS
ncbi:MAG: hypothetical protein U9O89_02360 [Thermoproteota archaeon]|nr:hypothetical protein [Thermoproteota archaeon]